MRVLKDRPLVAIAKALHHVWLLNYFISLQARACGVEKQRDDMFTGEKINITEVSVEGQES